MTAEGARSAPVVPETALLDAVLATMRRERAQFAVVIDEHGGTSGVVTLEDLFEEVVGEIDDSPERQSGPRRDSYGRLRVPGTMRLDELGQLFDLELTHEDVDSVSGLVLTLLGRPPRMGDSVELRSAAAGRDGDEGPRRRGGGRYPTWIRGRRSGLGSVCRSTSRATGAVSPSPNARNFSR